MASFIRTFSFLKSIISRWVLQPLAFWYLASDRSFRYNGLKVRVKKGVFHSGLFFSSIYVSHFLESQDLKEKTFLELGAGTGLISMVAARKGAIVTSIDINPDAIENLKLNFAVNNLASDIILSDFFSAIPKEKNFDMIIITPPYYPKEPKTNAEKAWFCGENFEYFESLFAQLTKRIFYGNCYMVLSEDCAIEKIKSLAAGSGLSMEVIYTKKFLWEENYIFRIEKL